MSTKVNVVPDENNIFGKPPAIKTVTLDIAALGWTGASTNYETTITGLNREATRRTVLISETTGVANYFGAAVWIWDSTVTKPSGNHTRTGGTNNPASLSNLGSGGYGGVMGNEFAGLGSAGDTLVFQYQGGSTANTTGTFKVTVIESFG